ncbi:MAG: nicotinamide riboside transporter PnuC [Vicingaceae bacterium]
MSDFLEPILAESQHFSWLETIAVLTALIYVYFASKGNRVCFFFGLISSAIYIYIATDLKYYFDSLINAYYVIMSVYGWFSWKSSRLSELEVKSMPKSQFGILILTGITISLFLGFASYKLTDAQLPFWDAITTVFSLIATWLVVKKVLQNWLIWIVVDFIAMIMYYEKGLLLTSLLFLIYTIIAIRGYFIWRKEIKVA